jgi:hypothetical protein
VLFNANADAQVLLNAVAVEHKRTALLLLSLKLCCCEAHAER